MSDPRTCPKCGAERRAVTARRPEDAWECGACEEREKRARELARRGWLAPGDENAIQEVAAALADAYTRGVTDALREVHTHAEIQKTTAEQRWLVRERIDPAIRALLAGNGETK